MGYYTLSANVENLTLMPGKLVISATGNELSNILGGNNADNILEGKGGDDNLWGNGGKDTLVGGEGVDHLYGGDKADIFRFEIASDSGIGLGNRDIIADFYKDKIDLSMIDANIATAADDAFFWKGTAAFTSVAGELRYFTEDSSHTVVEGDINADGIADFQIQLSGIISLSKNDFIL